MKKWFLFLIIFLAIPKMAFAQTTPQFQPPKEEFFKAKVIEIVSQGQKTIGGNANYHQTLRVKIEDGSEKGKYTVIENGGQFQITKDQLVSKDQEIVISKITTPNGKVSYSIYDFYRINSIILLLIFFFFLIVFIAGKKGLGSVFGMVISLGIITSFIVPNILKGSDPLSTTLLGSVVILIATGFLAHGVSKKTSIALFSTLISLLFTVGLAQIAIQMTNLAGLGSEDAVALQFGPTALISLKGLFLSGVIIGTLGALNDITTTQSATIYELKLANPKLKFVKLLEKGLNVGKEHAASLVNTLILAYAGSSFAIFIFLALNPGHLPYWVILNNETIADEIVKTIAGSCGLLLSVPIVTFLSAYFFSKANITK